MTNRWEWEKESRFCRNEYFLLGDVTPVIFLVDKAGDRYGACRPGDAPGELKPDATLLSKFDIHPEEFEEVGEAEWRRRLSRFAPRIVPADSSRE